MEVYLVLAWNWNPPFQSKDECEYLINLAKPHMHKSSVVDSETGKSKDSRSAFHSVFASFDIISFRMLKDIHFFRPFSCLYIYMLYASDIISTSRVRTSSGTFLARGRDKTVREIEKRIADFTFLPVGMWLELLADHFLLYVFFLHAFISLFVQCCKIFSYLPLFGWCIGPCHTTRTRHPVTCHLGTRYPLSVPTRGNLTL